MDWSSVEDWSYLVTVIGLPLAIFVWILEQVRESKNDEEEIYHLLSESYADFLKQVLENADLQLRSSRTMRPLTDEQRERKLILFDILVALFERSYIFWSTKTKWIASIAACGNPGKTTCANGADARISARCCPFCLKAKIQILPHTFCGFQMRFLPNRRVRIRSGDY